MSVYPVKLSEWFPPGDLRHDTAIEIIKIFRCLACNKKLRWKSAIGHHSLPFGQGDAWCSWKCCRSNKIAEPDYRRERRLKRKFEVFNSFINDCPACAGLAQFHENCPL